MPSYTRYARSRTPSHPYLCSLSREQPVSPAPPASSSPMVPAQSPGSPGERAARNSGGDMSPLSSPMQFSPVTDEQRTPATARARRVSRPNSVSAGRTPTQSSGGLGGGNNTTTPRNLNTAPNNGFTTPGSARGQAFMADSPSGASPSPFGARTTADRHNLGNDARRRSMSRPVFRNGGGSRDPTSQQGGYTPGRPSAGEARTEEMESESGVEQTFVWGTTVNVNDTRQRFKRFVHNFEKPDSDALVPFYLNMLQQMIEKEAVAFNLDCHNLHSFDPELYNQLVQYPQEVIPIFDFVVQEEAAAVLRARGGDDDNVKQERLQVRTYNLMTTKHMRELNPTDIDQMVCIRGMVTRTTGVQPDLQAAFFKCDACGHAMDPIPIDRGRIVEPERCPRAQCAMKFSMQMVHNRCSFSNRQQVKMQETPDEMPEGETPHTVNMCLFDDMVDIAKPGDRVQVTGIYRAVPIRVAPNRRSYKSVYKTYLDIIHIKKDEATRMRNEAAAEENATGPRANGKFVEDDRSEQFTPAQVERFKAIAADKNLYDVLVGSLAPSIWEMEDIKKGVLCLLFGGANQDGAGQNGKFRGEINVLLVGDPGVSKSQLLSYVNKIAPRGIYTSGRGSSAVGLTAYVTKDPETRDMVLESGALVLSDKGVCCIDEFDKMSDSARSMLHEVMEQQTVSVAKAGLICTLNARTSVLASANPIGSRYNPAMTVVDNIQLPPTLLSRFDLIYLLLDKVDQTRDRKLANHLVAMHFAVPPAAASQASLLSQSELTDYISYARTHVQPVLTDAAADQLVEGYVDMRRLGGHKKVITATPRQLESLIRLAEALARMRLSSTVQTDDVHEALRLMKSAMKQSCTDPKTGMIDMDSVQTGKTAHDRFMEAQLAEGVKSILVRVANKTLGLNDVLKELNTATGMNVQQKELRNAVQALVDSGDAKVAGANVMLVR